MKHPERVDDYLGHIIEAIERVTAYIAPLQTLDALQQHQKTQDATNSRENGGTICRPRAGSAFPN